MMILNKNDNNNNSRSVAQRTWYNTTSAYLRLIDFITKDTRDEENTDQMTVLKLDIADFIYLPRMPGVNVSNNGDVKTGGSTATWPTAGRTNRLGLPSI